jgi:MoaA/NifB/PqqE/SkfB family radical SAM enzyme
MTPPRERTDEARSKRALPVLGPSGATSAEPSIEARIEADRGHEGGGRVHILTGAICNNNCVFCMEEDRDGRYVTNSATTDETVKQIVAAHPHAEEICFTSGEPTTNKRFPYWVKLAKDEGAKRISVMTNGRALGHEPYTKLLVAAGLRRVYVSIHGHTQKLHEGLTRTPESFDQTVAGIRTTARFKPYGVELHTSTVVTKRNLPHMLDVYRFLRGLGVDQVVFNVMQANGRADTHFEHIFPTYTEIARTFAEMVIEAKKTEPRPMAFLVDIPLCTTEAVPDENRGYVEAYSHYEQVGNGTHDERLVPKADAGSLEGGLVEIARDDLDKALRTKRAECARCKYDRVCEGVWVNYLKRYGWDEMVPVPSNVIRETG